MTTTLQLDMDQISIGDLEDFEEYTGQTIDQIDKAITGQKVSMKVLTGVALLALRQDNPDATIADAKRVKISELMGGADDDPTVAGPVELKPLRDEKLPARKTRTAG